MIATTPLSDSIVKLRRLQEAIGSIRKTKLLREFQDDANFRNFLYYALNPMLTYKISEQTLRSPTRYDSAITLTMTDIFSVCEMLSKRKALDAGTVYQVCAFVQSSPPDEADVYIKLLSKTLRLGVTAKTVNKVIPNLIPEWEIQQAYPIDKYPLKEDTEFWLTQKLNGVRATYYKSTEPSDRRVHRTEFIEMQESHPKELRTMVSTIEHWKVVGDAINSAQITLWASGRKSSQVWKSALTQSLHILPNIISVPMANIIMAKLLKGSAFGITETPSGQK